MKITLDTFIDSLQSSLRVAYLNSRQTELTVRCPYCGDSDNINHGHLNIKVDDEECVVWRCVRCDTSGFVTPQFIRNLKITNDIAIRFAHKNSINASKIYKKVKTSITGPSKFRDILIPITDDTESIEKLEYVQDRLGVKISLQDAVNRYKMILNLEELWKCNHWMKMQENPQMMRMLADYGVGFLSIDKSKIIFRDVYGWNWSKRYFNYNIHGYIPDSSSIYTISKNINLLSTNMEVIIAEGILDVMGIALNILPAGWENNQNLFIINAAGKSYVKSINLVRSYGFLDFNLRIFTDNDVNNGFFIKIKKRDPILYRKKIEINRNIFSKKENDFGLPLHKIKLQRGRI